MTTLEIIGLTWVTMASFVGWVWLICQAWKCFGDYFDKGKGE